MTKTDSTSLHGVCISVYDVGILLLGKSGIGKSECALDLLTRGHRLIADDSVMIRRLSPEALIACSPETIKYHMEIRGIGIINIKELFGMDSICEEKELELVIELMEWDPDRDFDRHGLSDRFYDILDAKLPFLQLPLKAGLSLSSIIEAAVRNQILKKHGIHSAAELQKRLVKHLQASAKKEPS